MICQSVKYSTSIRTVDFTGCNLTWRGAEHMANIIKVEYLILKTWPAIFNVFWTLAIVVICNQPLFVKIISKITCSQLPVITQFFLSIRECRDMVLHGQSLWGIDSRSLREWEVSAVSPLTVTLWLGTGVLLLLHMNWLRISGLKVSTCVQIWEKYRETRRRECFLLFSLL